MKYESTFNAIDAILRNEAGCSNELDYIEQTSWLLFLKYLDDLETEREDEAALNGKEYRRIITGFNRWNAWAAPKTAKGELDVINAMTGDDLVEFVNQKLFPSLKHFKDTAVSPDTLEYKIGEIFSELRNKVSSGYNMREIINKIDSLHFQSADDKHEMTVLYEDKIKRIGNAGRNGGGLANPTDLRIFAIAQALEEGYTIDRIYELTKIDPWFIGKLKNIVDFKHKLEFNNKIEDLSAGTLCEAKILGFSDFQIARFVLKNKGGNMEKENLAVRAYRKKLGILPAVKRIPTVASEHPELTNYLYMTYSVEGYDINYYQNEKSVIVLGSGAYRIGSSVEFDWCSVNAINTARKLGYKSIMINYNPETVSTDYDMCDRLYFDELSFERVLDVIDLENPRGVIVSVGGQIPNNLAMKLYRQSVPILGTSPVSIDRAENRNKFSAMLDSLNIDQPEWSALTSMDDVKAFVDRVGFPVLVRPSYVLSGAAMNVYYDYEELERFLALASEVSKEYPVVISQFMQETNEIEFDAVAQDGEVVEYGISEHVEYAGVHLGDATMVFPAQQISFGTVRQIKKLSRAIAKELNISGPFNIQFLAKGRDVKVIECNLRASRSFPFVNKVLKRNFIETATRIMLDAPYAKPDKSEFDIDRMGVKASQFSFARLQNADPVLGVDMSSTGEVGCLGDTYEEAMLNALIATGYKIPSKEKDIMISSGSTKEKAAMLDAARALDAHGYSIYATEGTAKFLVYNGVKANIVGWPDEDGVSKYENVMKMISDHKFDLIINIPKNHTKRELSNGYRIRRGAIDHNIPLITNARLATAFIEAFCAVGLQGVQVKSWQEYV